MNDEEQIDQDLGLLIDRIIETVLTLEYQKGQAEIIPFRRANASRRRPVAPNAASSAPL